MGRPDCAKFRFFCLGFYDRVDFVLFCFFFPYEMMPLNVPEVNHMFCVFWASLFFRLAKSEGRQITRIDVDQRLQWSKRFVYFSPSGLVEVQCVRTRRGNVLAARRRIGIPLCAVPFRSAVPTDGLGLRFCVAPARVVDFFPHFFLSRALSLSSWVALSSFSSNGSGFFFPQKKGRTRLRISWR